MESRMVIQCIICNEYYCMECDDTKITFCEKCKEWYCRDKYCVQEHIESHTEE